MCKVGISCWTCFTCHKLYCVPNNSCNITRGIHIYCTKQTKQIVTDTCITCSIWHTYHTSTANMLHVSGWNFTAWCNKHRIGEKLYLKIRALNQKCWSKLTHPFMPTAISTCSVSAIRSVEKRTIITNRSVSLSYIIFTVCSQISASSAYQYLRCQWTETTHQERVNSLNHAVHWMCGWRHGTSVYVLAFMLKADISSIWCKDDVTYYTFDDFWDDSASRVYSCIYYSAIQWFIKMYM